MPKSIKIAPLWQQKLVVFGIKCIGHLPNFIGYSIAKLAAQSVYVFMCLGLLKKKKRIALINYQFSMPNKSNTFYEHLLHQNLHNLFALIYEFCRLWTTGANAFISNIKLDINDDSLSILEKKEAGVLLITPHLGNWELFGLWAAKNFGINAMFKESSMPLMDSLITSGREQYGGKIITADVKGVVKFLKLLKTQEVILRLPDHKPKDGGIVVDFLNYPAYSETLNAKLIQKIPDTQVVVGAAVRHKKHGFILKLKQVDFQELTVEHITQSINDAMSALILEHPEQYHWFYQRFRKVPGLGNPYRKP